MLHHHVRARAFESARHQLDEMLSRINICIDQHTGKTTRTLPWEYVELVITVITDHVVNAAPSTLVIGVG